MDVTTERLDRIEQAMSGVQRACDDARRGAHKAAERVIVFIDRSNLDTSFRRNDDSGWKIDYPKLVGFLRSWRFLQQVRVYYSEHENTDAMREEEVREWHRRQEFYNFLRHQGYYLRMVKRRTFDGQTVEKGLDAALILDMERLCKDNRCDTAVLVAGDADYCDVVSSVQNDYATRVEVAFFQQQLSKDLLARASRFINLSEARDRIVRLPTPMVKTNQVPLVKAE